MSRSGDSAEVAEVAHQCFTDSLGRQWDVWDVVPSRVERRRAEGTWEWGGVERRTRLEHRARIGERWAHGWLAFESDGEKRRLAPVPRDWHKLTAAELERLCGEAVRVPRSRRLVE